METNAPRSITQPELPSTQANTAPGRFSPTTQDYLLARIATLEAALSDAKRDAERYRWLRDHSEGRFVSTATLRLGEEEYKHEWFGKMAGEYVDKAIDAALAANGAGNG